MIKARLATPARESVMLEIFVRGLALRTVVFGVFVLCDSDPHNCKECAEMCSPLPVLECAVLPDKVVKCLCDGRGQRGYEPPKER